MGAESSSHLAEMKALGTGKESSRHQVANENGGLFEKYRHFSCLDFEIVR
jgi:hypothetical protein